VREKTTRRKGKSWRKKIILTGKHGSCFGWALGWEDGVTGVTRDGTGRDGTGCSGKGLGGMG